ncbi:uncharacterized protein LOC123665387 [Melitaea cinxia]|uniref:uncharacterized protein LOC123665387 n=1 Tax=Melitaea cinxia TaxID=113334 RepID=UPI001E26FDB3|nr:uncharacterized protein LOC123665387 [Melitaea cinxia]
MGKFSYGYSDSEETDDTSSSVENVKKKKRMSILKYASGNVKKKKCKVHSKSEPDEDFRSRSRSSQRMFKQKLRGILKHSERESSEDDDSEPIRLFRTQDRCLVGQVPRPAGAKPGRGGGVALVVRKNTSILPYQQSSTSSTKKRKGTKRLDRKRSY